MDRVDGWIGGYDGWIWWMGGWIGWMGGVEGWVEGWDRVGGRVDRVVGWWKGG